VGADQGLRGGHEERKTILSLEPEFKAPEPERFLILHQLRPARSRADGTRRPPSPVYARTDPAKAPGTRLQSVATRASTAFYNGETISRAQQEGLPIPPQTTDQARGDADRHHLHPDPQLSALATRLPLELRAHGSGCSPRRTNRASAAEQLEHDAHRDAYIQAYEMHKSAIPEEKPGPTALDAARKLAEKDADDAAKVREFRSKKIRHQMDANELKALARVYDRSVWRITDELQRRGMVAKNSFAAK
jgi:hypothetical protein